MDGRITTRIDLQDIDNWFNIGKTASASATAQSHTINRLSQQERNKPPPKEPTRRFIPPYKRHSRLNNPNQTAYGEHYQRLEEAKVLQEQDQHHINSGGDHQLDEDSDRCDDGGHAYGGMDDLETASVITGISSLTLPEGLTEEEANRVYESYDLAHEYNSRLAITQYQSEIIKTIESNSVSIIDGRTGSGKTTQVPQYILDHYARLGKYCNIIVTQPRRIAAISIATRVCKERGWTLGGLCGYQIAMDRQGTEDTRLLYCTTGVLKQKLINKKDMNDFTHVILDEVHERDAESDFLLLIVRKLLRTNSRDVKVILMSATIDTRLFAEYFSIPVRGVMEPAPVFSVVGQEYSVSEFYLQELASLGPLPDLDPNKPGISPEAYHIAKRLIVEFDQLEIKAQKQSASGFAAKRGSVLVFLPGFGEIQEMMETLEDVKEKLMLWLLPLHSTITGEEQARVFNTPEQPRRKVILSTNIAESSITVPDIKYVIDFCLTRELMADPETNYTSLQVTWASRANCDQRKGRAGRVSNGRVYRMVTLHFFETYIPQYGVPEMQRCPLDQLVLESKMLEMGEPKMILGLALSPPYLDDIEKTILVLREVGALRELDGLFNPHDGKLTFLGRVIAMLPVDIRVGKFILFGHVFGMLEEALIIGAALSLRSFFSQPYGCTFEAYGSKLEWAGATQSDPLALLRAYREWERQHNLGYFHRFSLEKQWGHSKFIQIKRMKEVHELVKDLLRRLQCHNIYLPNHQNMAAPSPAEEQLMLRLLLAASFYPNYFVCGKSEEEDAVRMIAGKNPLTTVMVKGLPNQQGALYRDQIQDLFQACGSRPKVSVEDTKAYIEFPHLPKEPMNKFPRAVYLAIKMRQLRVDMNLNLIDAEQARAEMKKMEELRDSRARDSRVLRTNRIEAVGTCMDESSRQVAIPGPEREYTPIQITEVVNCGHFWAQYADRSTSTAVDELQSSINTGIGIMAQPLTPGGASVGMICLARFQEDGLFYRARVTAEKGRQLKVFFVDYGNQQYCDISDTKIIPRELLELDFQAMEFMLCRIKPSSIKCDQGVWSKEAFTYFFHLVQGKNIYAKVFSVVDGVLRVDLYDQYNLHINEELVKKYYADLATESYNSQQSNLLRNEEMLNPKSRPIRDSQWMQVATPTSLSKSGKRGKVRLSGPSSPLEISFYSMTSAGRYRAARINRESVNSVALDDEPQSEQKRLMISSFVGLSPEGNTLQARDTTLMPAIPGLPALMALLFCPKAEMRANPKKTKYIGALCGLGADPDTGCPLLPDNDMEVTFDTVFDNKDLERINYVRMIMNYAIGGDGNETLITADGRAQIQEKARDSLLEVIKRRREPMTAEYFAASYSWLQVAPEDLLRPRLVQSSNASGVDGSSCSVEDYFSELFACHCAIVLNPSEDAAELEIQRKQTEKRRKKEHIAFLHKTASDSTMGQDLVCQLCDVRLLTPRELRMHLATRQHKEHETKILL